MTYTAEPYVFLNDAHGVYIPKLFCDDIEKSDCEKMGINWEDVKTCQDGPDNEWYWESWDLILSDFTITDDQGIKWYLYQDGDLWCYPEGLEFPEEF